MISKILKKIYYEKYTNKSYSISNVDLIINRMFSKIKNGIYNQNIESIINNKLYNMLIENNYKLINWVNSDLIFVRKDFKL